MTEKDGNEETMEMHRKEKSEIFARGDCNPRILGNAGLAGENSGEDQAQMVTVGGQKDMEILNNRRDKDFVVIDTGGPETSGLSILDPKRRRVDNLITNRPSNISSNEDDIMTETQTDDTIVPKNLLLAGAARQPRQTL